MDKVTEMTAGGAKKMSGWYSWRHQTRDEQDAARQEYIDTHATARARIARRRRRAEKS